MLTSDLSLKVTAPSPGGERIKKIHEEGWGIEIDFRKFLTAFWRRKWRRKQH